MKLSERDVCTKFITPARVSAGWDMQTQIREELSFTKGRIIVRGKLHSRRQARRADYAPYARPNQSGALIEAKDQGHSLGAGMQQTLDYADALDDVPFVFSSNGGGFLFQDRRGSFGQQGSLRVAIHDLEATSWQVCPTCSTWTHPMKASCWLNERPSTIRDKWAHPDRDMLEPVVRL